MRIALFLIALGYYLFNLLPSVHWLDTGEFVSTSFLLSLPHPPGHPLYVLLGKLAAFLPLGSIAFRVNLLSALLMAAGIVLVYKIALDLLRFLKLEGHRWHSPLLALLAMVSSALYLQATRCEVYALNLVFSLVLMLFTLRFFISARTGGGATPDGRLLKFCFFAIGLGLGNHHLLIFLILPALALSLFMARHKGMLPSLLRAVPFVVLGLSVYLVLPLRALSGGMIGWGAPDNLDALMHTVSASTFQKTLVPFSFSLLGENGAAMARFFAGQFSPVLWAPFYLLLFTGIVILWRKSRGLLLLLLGLCFFNIASKLFGLIDLMVPDVAGYFALSVVSLFLIIGVALGWLGALNRFARVGAALFLAAATVIVSWQTTDRARSGNFIAHDYAESLLQDLPDRSLVVLSHYDTVFLSWYLQGVERSREDLTLLFRGFMNRKWFHKRARLHRRVKSLRRLYPEGLLRAGAAPEVFFELGIRMHKVPRAFRERLEPAGYLFRLGNSSIPALNKLGSRSNPAFNLNRIAEWWRRGRAFAYPLDRESARYLLWLHFQHGAFHSSRSQTGLARWHLKNAWRLSPGDEMIARELKKLDGFK